MSGALDHISEREIIESFRDLKIGQKQTNEKLDKMEDNFTTMEENWKSFTGELKKEVQSIRDDCATDVGNVLAVATDAKTKADNALFQSGLLWGAMITIIVGVVLAFILGILKLS